MIGVVLATLMTVNTHNGTINYLFRKPQNGPNFVKETIAPEYETFSVYMLSKAVVQNLNIEITVSNAKTNMVSLLYDSTNGVAFEFVRFQVVCDKCNRLSFAPVLQTPMVGLFWCVVNITKMQYMYVPEMTVLKGSYFYVDEFLLEKGRFHTVIDNHVFASSKVQAVRYGSVGTHVDRDYVSDSTERCLSCSDSEFRLDSQCSCGYNGVFKGGQCYKQINATTLLNDSVNSTVKYFLKCMEARSSIITINQTITAEGVFEYRTFLTADCDLSNTVITGSIVVNQSASSKNSLFGMSDKYTFALTNINVSLTIKYINDGLGSSSLMFRSIEYQQTISVIRLTGGIECQGQSSNDGFGLLAISYGEYGSVTQFGIFGAVINVTSDNVGLLYSYAPVEGMAYLRGLIISPLLPEEYRFLPYERSETMELGNTDFPCFSYSNPLDQANLKYAAYFDVLAELGGEIKESTIVIRGGGNNVGGIYGVLDAFGGCDLSSSSIRLVIDNKDQATAKSCVGVITGHLGRYININETYLEGVINSNSKRVGLIGALEVIDGYDMFVFMAAKLKITASEEAGIFGHLNGGGVPMQLNAIVDVEVTCPLKAGMFGSVVSVLLVQQVIGVVTLSDGAFRAIGECGADVSVNGYDIAPGYNVQNVLGSYVNTCAGDESYLQYINVTDLIATTIDSLPAFYAAECVSSARITVNVTKQLSGRRIVQILASDSCNPSNIQIQGALTLDTQEVGTTELQIAGLVLHSTVSLLYFNTSLDIKHIGLAGTKCASLLAYDTQKELKMEFVRISGTILGDSKGDVPEGVLVAFIYCKMVYPASIDLTNVGLYGAQINFTGAEAIGMFARIDPGARIRIYSLIVTRLAGELKLISQFQYDKYYFYSDSCANKISGGRDDSLNYEQYYKYFGEGRVTGVFVSQRRTKNTGIIAGLLPKEGWNGGDLSISQGSVDAKIHITTNSNCTGIIAGQAHGFLNINLFFLTGDIVAKRRVGAVGEIGLYTYFVMTCRLNITGSSDLGTFGRAIGLMGTFNIYFDNHITSDETFAGGMVGYLEQSPYFDVNGVVGRCVIVGDGLYNDLMVGYADAQSTKNFYDNVLINKC